MTPHTRSAEFRGQFTSFDAEKVVGSVRLGSTRTALFSAKTAPPMKTGDLLGRPFFIA
jgi:hypothetical protein